jgi:small subunit ribosomal protein S13
MIRISGINFPPNKTIFIALTYVFGIGYTQANKILTKINIPLSKKCKDLTDVEVIKLRSFISKIYQTEGTLKKLCALSIKRHVEIGSIRGRRHRVGLPVRGQRTRTNAKTRKKRR